MQDQSPNLSNVTNTFRLAFTLLRTSHFNVHIPNRRNVVRIWLSLRKLSLQSKFRMRQCGRLNVDGMDSCMSGFRMFMATEGQFKSKKCRLLASRGTRMTYNTGDSQDLTRKISFNPEIHIRKDPSTRTGSRRA